MGEIGHQIEYHLWPYLYTFINYLQKSLILDMSAKRYLKCELINESISLTTKKGCLIFCNKTFRSAMICFA